MRVEPKSWPFSTRTISAARTASASTHPQMKATARSLPDDMLSKTITVTTEPGLVNATARPRAAISGISVPNVLPRQFLPAPRDPAYAYGW